MNCKELSHLWCVARFGALRDLVRFVQFKEREKHSRRSVNSCNFTKINTPPWVFLTFFKLHKWYQIAQRITYNAALAIIGAIRVLLKFIKN